MLRVFTSLIYLLITICASPSLCTMRKPVAAYQISIVSQWLKGRVFCLLFAKEVTQDVRQERTKELLLSKLYPSASLVK